METERFFLRLLPLSRQVDRMCSEVAVGECIVECAFREAPSHLNIPDVCRGICAIITREKSSSTYVTVTFVRLPRFHSTLNQRIWKDTRKKIIDLHLYGKPSYARIYARV